MKVINISPMKKERGTSLLSTVCNITATAALITEVTAFSPQISIARASNHGHSKFHKHMVAEPMSESTFFPPSDGIVTEENVGDRDANGKPFTPSQTLDILTGELAGDFGFDPLNLASSKEELIYYREAEIKHSRLAMLAAVGWPISEIFEKNIVQGALLDQDDRVPSVLNGGLEKTPWQFWVGSLLFASALELYGIKLKYDHFDSFSTNRQQVSDKYIPGDFKFDPLSLYPTDEENRKRVQLSEIMHGRIAMVAVTGFAVQEAVLHQGVIDETPYFFTPMNSLLWL